MKKISLFPLFLMLAAYLQAQTEISHYTYDLSGNQITRSRPAIIHGVSTTADVSIGEGSSATLWATGGAAYAWSTGDTTAQITVAPVVTTVYAVTVTCACGTTQVNHVTVTVSPTVAVQEETFQVTFAIAPNPAVEQLTVQISLPEAVETTLHLCDAQGKEIWQRSVSGSELTLHEDCHELAKGTYRLYFFYKKKQYSRTLVVL